MYKRSAAILYGRGFCLCLFLNGAILLNMDEEIIEVLIEGIRKNDLTLEESQAECLRYLIEDLGWNEGFALVAIKDATEQIPKEFLRKQ